MGNGQKVALGKTRMGSEVKCPGVPAATTIGCGCTLMQAVRLTRVSCTLIPDHHDIKPSWTERHSFGLLGIAATSL